MLPQFPLCISIEIDCLKNEVDLLSIVLFDINFPTSLKTEVVSKAFSVVTSRVNISWRERIFWPTKGTAGLQHHIFWIFDGKQHPKNIRFHGC